jgi:hypothetical protein
MIGGEIQMVSSTRIVDSVIDEQIETADECPVLSLPADPRDYYDQLPCLY